MAMRLVARLALGLIVLVLPVSAVAAADAGVAERTAGSPGQAYAAHGEAGGLNPLNFKTDLAIYTAVVFLVLLFLLWKTAWGPIARGLDQREQRIHDEIAAAERANQEAQERLAQYEARLDASEAEIREMHEQARRDAEQIGRGIVEKAREETEAEKQRALREIETATAGALKELAERSATLAVELAGRIVHARLDPASHAKLIEEAVDRFDRSGNGQGTHS